MGFSLSPGIVEGNLFVRRSEAEGVSGKWKYTIFLDMNQFWGHGPTVQDAVLAAWHAGSFEGVVSGATGFWLVVTEPYCKGGGYPIMVAV
jgi:hypothetical protein